MDGQQIKQLLQTNKEHLFKAYPLSTMALFGSYTDGTATEESDVDILMEFKQPVGFEFIDLSIELENLLQKPVDLVTRQAIKPNLIPFITRQLQYV
ncbi:nucleotidyltransferase family protein [Spirosoma sp. BT702]|uniref:Nucleotidyltransferase family protein n=1 Tax=Spirosoma profusum TaxID=2771354 RepID=A0A926Y529_9BACT|nr:nucleotidyltransferase family protein [Spirosoma profusum]MBD2703941.1 nucleotidyltransferase family protein [Spirosoma profusum]